MAGIIFPRVAREKMNLSFNKMTIKKAGRWGEIIPSLGFSPLIFSTFEEGVFSGDNWSY